MELREAIKILKDHNMWRRYDNTTMQNPSLIGEAIDTVVREYEKKQTFNSTGSPWIYQNNT